MTPEQITAVENGRFHFEKILVAGNRGPCGGVNMAIEVADQVLSIVGGREKVYTNWPIVNNDPIMKEYVEKGLVDFRNDWSKVPDNSIVIFSAHGVTPEHHRIAMEKGCLVIDTTCQLVTRVHNLVKRAQMDNKHIVYIGSKGHPETVGVMSEVESENITLVQKPEDVAQLAIGTGVDHIVYSQTTLMTMEVDEIEKRLMEKFPDIYIPDKLGICYATYNRQLAVENMLAAGIDTLIVVGSKGSHNSEMLKRMGERAGIFSAKLDYPEELDLNWLKDKNKPGLTSGASVLDRFLNPVVSKISLVDPKAQVEYLEQAVEEKDMTFKLPQEDIDRLHERWAA